jgi:hypothetical protein
MKNSLWLIIGIIVYTAAVVICFFPTNSSFGGVLFAGIIIAAVISLAIAIGYSMIYFLEKKDIYNMFAAILMPLMPVLALWLIISLVPTTLGYAELMLFPFLVIASSFGGVLAHKKRLKQQA